MTGSKLTLRWSDEAKASLREIYEYIRRTSPLQAEKVKEELLGLAETLIHFPKKYSRDPFIPKSRGEFRFVPKWSYKIVYGVTRHAVVIVDIFHTAQHSGKLRGKVRKRK